MTRRRISRKPHDPEIQAPRPPRTRDLADDDDDTDELEAEAFDVYCRPGDEATSTDRHRYAARFAVGVGLWD